MHWGEWTRLDEDFKTAFFYLAKKHKVPALERVAFEARAVGPGRWQDPGNCYPSVKAAIDGIVRAGVIPDDTAVYVASILLLPWVKQTHHWLQITIVEVP